MRNQALVLAARSLKKIKIALFFVLGSLISAGTLLSFEPGAKAGFNLSFYKWGSGAIYNASNLLSVKGGVFAAWRLNGRFSLQLGINYVAKGASYYSAHARDTKTVLFKYLEIPLLADIPIIGKTFYCIVGPYYGILFDSPPLGEGQDWTSPTRRVKRSDYGLVVGVRRQIKKAFLELQYTAGFVKVIYEPNESSPYQASHYNRCVVLLFGTTF